MVATTAKCALIFFLAVVVSLTLRPAPPARSAVTTAGLAGSPWPMFHHDVEHTGRSSNFGPPSASVKWHIGLHAAFWDFSPVIAADGTIYVLNGAYLEAMTPGGTVKWAVPDRE